MIEKYQETECPCIKNGDLEKESEEEDLELEEDVDLEDDDESMQEGKETVTNDTFLEILKTCEGYENMKKIVKDDLIADIIFAIDDIHNDT